jgi:hypothetical protein
MAARRKTRNPAKSAQQFGAALSVLAGRSKIFAKKVAREIVDATPLAKRRQFGKQLAAHRSNPKGKRKGNPMPADMRGVARRAALFHGKAPTKVRTVEQPHFVQTKQADLGRMIDLDVKDLNGVRRCITFAAEGPRQVRLATNKKGTQLYFTGGDQEVGPRTFGAMLPKDSVLLGDVVAIGYFTSKDFHNFKPSAYGHKFGEVLRDGRRVMNPNHQKPALHYDTHTRRLKLVGGSYTVQRAGIVN